MRQSTKSSSSKRGSGSTTTSKRSGPGRSMSGSSRRSSSTNEEDRYGALGTRMSANDSRDYRRDDYEAERGSEYDYGRRGSSDSDYGREGVRTISGRYSDFEDYGGSSRNWQDRDESERGFARGGRRGEYSSVNDQDFYEGNTGRSPWRDTYESERSYPSRGASRSQNYSGQGRGYSEFNYDDDRINSRESRYGSFRDRNDRWMNNYDNQDEGIDDEYGFRERYNENRY